MSQTTYRIEQWTREGQILRSLYVDDDGRPLTLRMALDGVEQLRPRRIGNAAPGETEIRIVNNSTDKPIDEEYERLPWWLKSSRSASAESSYEVARMLEELAEALRAGGDQPIPTLSVSVGLAVEYHGADRDDVRRGGVELLARLTGQELIQRGGTYESIEQSVYLSTYAMPPVEPEPVDEPDYLVDVAGREDPETGEPVPDGVEGHPVGRVVEQTARAILQPDTLPNPAGVEPVDQDEREPVDGEKRCDCGQPWALLISGNAKHVDGCPNLALGEGGLPEAGETEDALGVPGLTSDEADDFMSGGAR